MKEISFTVPGIPRPGGSKRHVGRGILVDAGKHTKQWRSTIIDYARAEMGAGWVPMQGPVYLHVVFVMPRPKVQIGKYGQIKPHAPVWHTSRPDTTKLLRALEDALTDAGVWLDDSCVCGQSAKKRYCEYAELPGAYITIGCEEASDVHTH